MLGVPAGESRRGGVEGGGDRWYGGVERLATSGGEADVVRQIFRWSGRR